MPTCLPSLDWQGIWRSGLAHVCRWSGLFARFVLPFLVGALVAFLGYFFAEWNGDGALPCDWDDLPVPSFGTSMFVAVLALISGGLAHLVARRWPHWFNAFAVAGVSTTLALSLGFGTCEPLGGLFAGTVVVAMLFVMLLAREVRAGSLELPLERPLRSLVLDSSSAGWSWSGFVAALRCGLVLYMVLLLLLTFHSDIVPLKAVPLVLVFAGVGFSSASSISDEWDIRAFASLAGMVVSLVGSYMQVDDELVDAWHLMVAVFLVFLGPFVGLFSHVHSSVELLGKAVLVIAFLIVFFVAISLPFLLILGHCGLDSGVNDNGATESVLEVACSFCASRP